MHRSKIVILLLLLLPAVVHGIDKKKKLIIPGRWKEVKRMTPDSTVQEYDDTLYVAFLPKDSFSYHYRKGFIYEGVYGISEDSILDLGTVRFKVLLRKGEQMVLMNQKGVHHFGPDLSDTAAAIVIKKEDSSRPVNSLEEMIGRWSVYKRKTDGPGTLDAVDNIRSVYITGPSTDGKQGFVYSGADADNAPSWTVRELGGGQSLVCEGRRPRTFKVLRCQDGEMILEEGGVKYFLKQPK